MRTKKKLNGTKIVKNISFYGFVPQTVILDLGIINNPETSPLNSILRNLICSLVLNFNWYIFLYFCKNFIKYNLCYLSIIYQFSLAKEFCSTR